MRSVTGLPDTLKAGVESLSGLSLDDVHVHYHSSKPAQVQALAYTQGTEIHVGPGQERHLAHEAWHVVQQKQGRVKPTLQAKGMKINDDQGLEREADVMGIRATQAYTTPYTTLSVSSIPCSSEQSSTIQRIKLGNYETKEGSVEKKGDGEGKVGEVRIDAFLTLPWLKH